MDERTRQHYDSHAAEIAGRYEQADMSRLHRFLRAHLPEGGKVLEVGCGSGRDAAFLHSQGYDIHGIDGAIEMVQAAKHHHPELTGRLEPCAFPIPNEHDLLAQKFDAIISIATLMHIPEQDLFECACQFRKLLSENGTLIVSTSVSGRAKLGDRDSDGRLFHERPPEQLSLLFERVGFKPVTQLETDDVTGRGIKWVTMLFSLTAGDTIRPVDQLETIINTDKKDATYKLALLRALCEIAQTGQHHVRWYGDGTVSVPLGLVVEKWLFYYWPLIEPDVRENRVVIRQKRGGRNGSSVMFRKSMRELISHYETLGQFGQFWVDYHSDGFTSKARSLLDAALNKISEAIVSGPVTYAGGALEGDGKFFKRKGPIRRTGKCTSAEGLVHILGTIHFSANAWREMTLIGHWISESIILRWAELTEEITKQSVTVADVIGKLLTEPETKRDTSEARRLFRDMEDLRCVWTGVPIPTRKLEIDHVVPFALWHNNDLWNLLPADRKVNNDKRDKLVSREQLSKSRDAIIDYWRLWREQAPSRFDLGVRRVLAPQEIVSSNWEMAAFAGLVEAVESVAIQRGVQRWSA